MKKIFILFVCFISIFVVGNISANAAVSDTVKDVKSDSDVSGVKAVLNSKYSFDGRGFQVGIVGNLYRVSKTDVTATSYSRRPIAFVSSEEIIAGRNTVTFKQDKLTTVTSFVGFAEKTTYGGNTHSYEGITRGYEYTILSGLSWTTDTNSNVTTQLNSGNCLKTIDFANVYTSEVSNDGVSLIAMTVDPTKNKARLVWTAQVTKTCAKVEQIQKLWFGQSASWSKYMTFYVFSNVTVDVMYM